MWIRLIIWLTIAIAVGTYVAVMLPQVLSDNLLRPGAYTPDAEYGIRVEYILAGIAIALITGLLVLFLFVRSIDRD
jgi:heme/copper-type cytochrome/quinol oxidase subunit 2